MTYNFFPEKIVLSSEEAKTLADKGISLHKIEFPFNGRTLRAWSVCHNNKPEQKGFYALILEELFNKRVEMKNCHSVLAKKKEELSLEISTIKKRGKSVPDILLSEYNSIGFEHSCVNSKQGALKLYMNTFYSEAGRSVSLFFL